eukprot:tig00000980_g6145.t1
MFVAPLAAAPHRDALAPVPSAVSPRPAEHRCQPRPAATSTRYLGAAHSHFFAASQSALSRRIRSAAPVPPAMPAPVAQHVQPEITDALRKEADVKDILRVRSIGGGCINEAMCIETDAGSFFAKVNGSIGRKMFDAEAVGLKAMYMTKTVRVPEPICVGSLGSGGSFFVMYLESGSGGGSALQKTLGRQLAEMHLAPPVSLEGYGAPKAFGFFLDNTIGATPQSNRWHDDWVSFWAEERLKKQLELAEGRFGDGALREKGRALLDLLPALFDGLEVRPALLHGDLWSGNYGVGPAGEPVIFDPATYYGHSEAELSIMKMFGGFSPAFFDAYHAVIPKAPGFEKRMQLYQLYHYLNHLNLFGRGYYGSCVSLLSSLTS